MRKDFYQFLESKNKDSDSSNRIKAIVDLADALSKVFKRYTRSTRKTAWNTISSKQGKEEVDRLLNNPNQSLNRFRTL